ncbi:MAG: YfhO family protein [Smithella sp.]|jgi:hypothetical protein
MKININQISQKSKFLKHFMNLPYFLIPIGLATWLYAPVLFFGKTKIFGDSIIHNLSVIEFNRKMIHEGISPLWTNLLFGGHPYFAEGQGGFFNPLNFMVALLFNPITGQNIYNWLTTIIGALGMYGLCRQLRCGRAACTFGALVVVFSSYWLQYHDNITVSGAMCYIPWVFLFFERWIEHPVVKSSLVLAVSVSLLIFAGYPQAFHGTIIYMVVRMIPTLFSGYIGSRADNSLRQYLLTGLGAVAVCIGLTAVQWLPLVELAALSHRSGGVDIVFQMPLDGILRGFLFTISEEDNLIFRGLGSIFICFVASLSLTIKPNHRIIGHMIAGVFLVVLGMGYSLPVFEYLRKYSLVPGLMYFRGVHLYLGVGIVSIGLLAGVAIDRIQRQTVETTNSWKRKIFIIAGTSILFLICSGLVLRLRVEHVPIIQYASFIGAYVVLMVFIVARKQQWFGHAMLAFIIIEIVVLRIPPVPFSDSKLFEKPHLANYIQANSQNRDFKIMDITNSWIVGLQSLWSPRLEAENSKAFMRLFPSTNVLWNIPSMGACLALPLARQQLIQPKMQMEIMGTDSNPPGTRLIDYLGVRYLSLEGIPKTSDLKPLITDNIIIMENIYALHSIQSFTRYEMANSAEDALNRLKQSKVPTLILEPPFNKKESIKGLPASTVINMSSALEISSSKITNVEYKFDVHARQPAWLFIADANYPGWQAKIDGKSTPVYSAQVLGKAVFVPSGIHQVTIEFKPRSFMMGLFLLFFTLLILLIVGIRRIYSRRFLMMKL